MKVSADSRVRSFRWRNQGPFVRCVASRRTRPSTVSFYRHPTILEAGTQDVIGPIVVSDHV